MGFWPKVIVWIVIVIAGFMYIRSLAEKNNAPSVADSSVSPALPQQVDTLVQPQPASEIQEGDYRVGETVPITEIVDVIEAIADVTETAPTTEIVSVIESITDVIETLPVAVVPVITEEVARQPAQPETEPEESTAQDQQQAETKVPAPAIAVPETGEAAPVSESPALNQQGATSVQPQPAPEIQEGDDRVGETVPIAEIVDVIEAIADVMETAPTTEIVSVIESITDVIETLPVAVFPVITEEVAWQPAQPETEPEESTAQDQQQAETKVPTPVIAARETDEAAPEEPEQPAAAVIVKAPVPESVVAVETPASKKVEPTLSVPPGEPITTLPPDRPARPSFKEIFGYDRPPGMPFKYEGPMGQAGVEGAFNQLHRMKDGPIPGWPEGVLEKQPPHRMARAPHPGGEEPWGYPGRHTQDFSRSYPSGGSHGYGPGNPQDYAPPEYYQGNFQGYAPPGYYQGYFKGYAPTGYYQGYFQGYAPPGYYQGYFQGYAPTGYSQGYAPDHSQR